MYRSFFLVRRNQRRRLAIEIYFLLRKREEEGRKEGRKEDRIHPHELIYDWFFFRSRLLAYILSSALAIKVSKSIPSSGK